MRIKLKKALFNLLKDCQDTLVKYHEGLDVTRSAVEGIDNECTLSAIRALEDAITDIENLTEED